MSLRTILAAGEKKSPRTHQRRTREWATLVLIVAATGCYEQALVPDESNDRIEISNNEDELVARLSYTDEDVPIDPGAAQTAPVGASAAQSAPALAPSSVRLRLIAEVSPPEVSGQTVQATSIGLGSANRVIVSYGFAGATALGGLDLMQVVAGTTRPRLRSSARFSDTDILSTSMGGDYAFAALASADVNRPFPAVVERVLVSGNNFTLDGNLQTQLASFASTSTVTAGAALYATSGNTGSVYAIDPNDMTTLAEYVLDDARWVAWDAAGGRVVVAQGTPGRLSVFTEGDFTGGTLDLLNTFSFPGADVPESKTTVEVHGGKAFVAAGPEGVQVVCLDDGQIVGSVPRPDPASLGLDPSVVVTNAVTVDGDVMFISNGEAGVYVAVGDQPFADTPCSAPQSITLLGQLQFGNLQSANHVVFRDEYLYVAAGLGGMKVVRVTLR